MNIPNNLTQVKKLITQTEHTPGSVLLLAVSKQQSQAAIIEAYNQGVKDFGESYLKEARQKMDQLQSYPICWHFIGPIQSNKTKGIASHFQWVHSINSSKIAQALNQHRPSNQEPLNVCLQINLVEEKTKAGIAPERAKDLAMAVSQMPRLNLRGLMTIPPPLNNAAEHYELFSQLRLLRDQINQDLGISMDTLSMGMSDDLVPAIKAGATIVRVGRGVFGERVG